MKTVQIGAVTLTFEEPAAGLYFDDYLPSMDEKTDTLVQVGKLKFGHCEYDGYFAIFEWGNPYGELRCTGYEGDAEACAAAMTKKIEAFYQEAQYVLGRSCSSRVCLNYVPSAM